MLWLDVLNFELDVINGSLVESVNNPVILLVPDLNELILSLSRPDHEIEWSQLFPRTLEVHGVAEGLEAT